MQKLRIILISSLLESKGGAFIATSRIAEILKKNFIVSFLAPDNKSILNKIKNVIALILKRFFLGRTAYLNSLNIFSKIILKDSKFDLIHLNWTGNELISIDNLCSIKKPILWTMHDMWLPNSTEHFLKNPSKKKYLKSDLKNNLLKKIIFKKKEDFFKKKNIHLVANSKWLKDYAIKSELTKKCKIDVVYNPIETKIWKRKSNMLSKKKLHLQVDKDYILFGAVGGFSNFRKGGDLFLNSLDKLTEIKNKTEVIILGGKENSTEIINNRKFHFRKLEVRKMSQVMYHSASILTVCPSRAESLPQFIVETILCENPVVSFNVGGIKEIIKHKINGYVVKPFNTEEFANGIKFCMTKIKKKDLKQEKIRITQMFNEKKILKDYKNIINKVLRYES